MSNPVLLPSSKKICELKVISAHLKNEKRDPFDYSPLDESSLTSCDELKAEITEWTNKKKDSLYADKDADDGFRVASDDVKALTEAGGAITPEILQALLEADRLETALKEAEAQVESDRRAKMNKKRFNKWGEEESEGEENGENVVKDDDAEAAAASLAVPTIMAALETTLSAEAKESDIEQIINAPKQKRDARVLAVEKTRVLMHIDGRGIRPFLMSGGCFNEYTNQKDIYANCGRSPVVQALNGFNACLLAYGQTGSGKTHTIFGPGEILTDCLDVAQDAGRRRGITVSDIATSVLNTGGGEVGLAVRAACEVCTCLNLNEKKDVASNSDIVGTLSCQYVQIYNEQITCLLGSTNEVHVRGDVMHGARTIAVTSLPMMLELLVVADANKKRASTAMNDRSSRSHSILVFNIVQKNAKLNSLVKSVLHIVDLAGSERLKKSKVEGINKSEAININKSLMVLGKVVSALVEKKKHVPYFESKLTTILRNSFGGNSRTTAMVTARMDDEHASETLQSLRFGERCAAITNSVAAAATSATDAIKCIDDALTLCETQIASLEKRGMKHLPMYLQVKEKYATLKLKRAEIE